MTTTETMMTDPVAAPVRGASRKAPTPSDTSQSLTFASRARRRASQVLPGIVGIAVALLVWHIVAKANPGILPTPAAVWDALRSDPGFYFENSLQTFKIAALGLAITGPIAFLAAVVMSEVPVLERAVYPIAVVVQVTPIVALAPAMVVAFGFTVTPKLIIIGVSLFFPVLVNTLTGLRAVDPATMDVLKTLSASRLDILLTHRLPNSLPYLFAAARIAFPIAVVAAVFAEFAAPGADKGLGTVITISAANLQLPVIYAAIACLAAMGTLVSIAVRVAETIVLRRGGS